MGAREYDQKEIGMRLKSGLTDAGMEVNELAEAIGVSRYTVTEWIVGRRTPKLTTAAKICDVLGKPLDWLARRENTASA